MTPIPRTYRALVRWQLYALLWCTPLLTLLAGCGPGPAAPSGSVINFSRPEIALRSMNVVFPVTTTISSTVATRMIGDPDVFVVVFSTASGPVAIGRLKLVEPPEPD
jgi:hypothetical protein